MTGIVRNWSKTLPPLPSRPLPVVYSPYPLTSCLLRTYISEGDQTASLLRDPETGSTIRSDGTAVVGRSSKPPLLPFSVHLDRLDSVVLPFLRLIIYLLPTPARSISLMYRPLVYVYRMTIKQQDYVAAFPSNTTNQ